MDKLLTKTVYYTDWNVMIDRTKLDIEFLEAFQIKFDYRIVLEEDKIGIEFTCKT